MVFKAYCFLEWRVHHSNDKNDAQKRAQTATPPTWQFANELDTQGLATNKGTVVGVDLRDAVE